MGRDKTSPTHKFQIDMPENYDEVVEVWGQERADHLLFGAALIEARSAFMTYLNGETGSAKVREATLKMKTWAPRSEVGKRGDPVGKLSRDIGNLKTVDDIEAIERRLADMRKELRI